MEATLTEMFSSVFLKVKAIPPQMIKEFTYQEDKDMLLGNTD